MNQPVGVRRDSPDQEPVHRDNLSGCFQHLRELLFEWERFLEDGGGVLEPLDAALSGSRACRARSWRVSDLAECLGEMP